jgi:hypothetical protein
MNTGVELHAFWAGWFIAIVTGFVWGFVYMTFALFRKMVSP